MTEADFVRDPLTAIYNEIIVVEAAALRAERHLVVSPVRVSEARDAVVTVIELGRSMNVILRRATL